MTSDQPPSAPARVFLLSPAYCGGRRAGILLGERASFPLALELAAGRAQLGDVFAFMSGLYFRGKLAYARAFARSQDAVRVITPSRGLLAPDLVVSPSLLEEFAQIDVDSADVRYRGPLERDARALRARLPPAAEIVLLGSIATGKYVEALVEIFGTGLRFPREFVGRGDMSRGALLLRSAREGRELDYVPVNGSPRHGRRAMRIADMV
jgi:hypothetical protein